MNTQDIPRFSALSTSGAVVCAIGTSIFLSQFLPGMVEFIEMLEMICDLTTMTPVITDLKICRMLLLGLASVTPCFAVLAVGTDFLRKDARYSRKPLCMLCNGSGFSLCVSGTKDIFDHYFFK